MLYAGFSAISPAEFALAFRGAYQDVRDVFVARVRVGENSLKARLQKVEDQEWHFNACPMSGPFLELTPKGEGFWIAWMSDGRVFYAHSTGGTDFGGASSNYIPKERLANHPLVLFNRRREIFFAWEEGRNRRWQIADREGKTRDSGDAGALGEKSKATGFVDRRGDFCLVF